MEINDQNIEYKTLHAIKTSQRFRAGYCIHCSRMYTNNEASISGRICIIQLLQGMEEHVQIIHCTDWLNMYRPGTARTGRTCTDQLLQGLSNMYRPATVRTGRTCTDQLLQDWLNMYRPATARTGRTCTEPIRSCCWCCT